MATNGATDAEQQAFDAGVDAFLAKPLSPRRPCEVVDALESGAATIQP